MEFSIKQWTGIVGGWRKRTLLIGDNGYSIQKSKNSKHSLIFFSLNNANVIDTSSKSKGEDLQILIETSEYHNYFKTKDKNEIAKQSQTNNPFDLITLRFTHFQNLFLEMNQKLDKLKHLTTKSKIDELIIVHSNLVTIKEETAIPNEQQLIDNIIRILAKNNLSISEAKEILNITSKKLDEQKVMENGVYRH